MKVGAMRDYKQELRNVHASQIIVPAGYLVRWEKPGLEVVEVGMEMRQGFVG
jgi:hypothetical protein